MTTEKPPEPRFQFSLRDVFLTLAVLGGMLVFLAPHFDGNGWPVLLVVSVIYMLLAALASQLKGWQRPFGIVVMGALVFFLTAGIIPRGHGRWRNNEAMACAACKAYALGQQVFRRTDYDGDGLLEHVQSLSELARISPKCDDLLFINQAFVSAEFRDGCVPHRGYLFKILTAQGANAGGGKKSYLDDKGNLTEGYALVAWPAKWGRTGQNSFIINQSGTIYSADLGADTFKIASTMTEFDPDPKVWVPEE